jgi:lysozyme family protein
MTTFSACLAFTLAAEGGYSDDPQDAGGPTDDGITLATWQSYTGDKTATIAEISTLTPAEIASFYASMFWNPVQGDDLSPGVALMVFDHAVMSGVQRSSIILQRGCGALQDGHIGPLTVAAAARISPGALINTLEALQQTYLRSLVAFPRYGRGWLARLTRRASSAAALSPTET